jgi:probable phosphoglycerate mutase
MSPLIPPELGATLVLVRHGETTWLRRNRFQGRRNPHLTDLGRAQAGAVGARLADPLAAPPLPVPPERPVAIWHSPLRRAADTARAIGALVPAPLVDDERLAEMGQGDWEARSHRAVAALGPGLEAWRRDPVANAAPGGETLGAARPRIRAALAAILEHLADPPAQTGVRPSGAGRPWAIVVSHGGTMRVALLSLLDLPLSRFWSFPFEPCAITVVELDGGRAVLRAHNLTSHLAGAESRITVDRGGAL